MPPQARGDAEEPGGGGPSTQEARWGGPACAPRPACHTSALLGPLTTAGPGHDPTRTGQAGPRWLRETDRQPGR